MRTKSEIWLAATAANSNGNTGMFPQDRMSNTLDLAMDIYANEYLHAFLRWVNGEHAVFLTPTEPNKIIWETLDECIVDFNDSLR